MDSHHWNEPISQLLRYWFTQRFLMHENHLLFFLQPRCHVRFVVSCVFKLYVLVPFCFDSRDDPTAVVILSPSDRTLRDPMWVCPRQSHPIPVLTFVRSSTCINVELSHLRSDQSSPSWETGLTLTCCSWNWVPRWEPFGPNFCLMCGDTLLPSDTSTGSDLGGFFLVSLLVV